MKSNDLPILYPELYNQATQKNDYVLLMDSTVTIPDKHELEEPYIPSNTLILVFAIITLVLLILVRKIDG